MVGPSRVQLTSPDSTHGFRTPDRSRAHGYGAVRGLVLPQALISAALVRLHWLLFNRLGHVRPRWHHALQEANQNFCRTLRFWPTDCFARNVLSERPEEGVQDGFPQEAHWRSMLLHWNDHCCNIVRSGGRCPRYRDPSPDNPVVCGNLVRSIILSIRPHDTQELRHKTVYMISWRVSACVVCSVSACLRSPCMQARF